MSGGHGGGKSGKVWTILKVLFVVILLSLFIFWLLTGGPQRAWDVGKNFTNPVALIFGNGTSTGMSITLPWQPETTRGPDISDYVGAADDEQRAANGQSSDGGQATSNLQEYGTPSPYQGEVTLAGSSATASNASEEYLQIQASSENNGSINLSGWSVQSAVSGVRAGIPSAAPAFIAGVVNAVQPVALAPGATAIVTTGLSPVGVSFEENMCSGYLTELQRFTPALNASCPSPSDALPQNASNLRAYGASCFDYIADIPSCHFVGASMPSNISPACRQFVGNNLSYNGCVAMYRSQQNFDLPTYRLYLNQSSKLWNNSHDIIRLLDAQGQVVDVLSY